MSADGDFSRSVDLVWEEVSRQLREEPDCATTVRIFKDAARFIELLGESRNATIWGHEMSEAEQAELTDFYYAFGWFKIT